MDGRRRWYILVTVMQSTTFVPIARLSHPRVAHGAKVPARSRKPRKTARAVAALLGSLPEFSASFVLALSEEGSWWSRITLHGKYQDRVSPWTKMTIDPVADLGITVPHSCIWADVLALDAKRNTLDVPGIECWGPATEVLIEGDCGRRYHLPKETI